MPVERSWSDPFSRLRFAVGVSALMAVLLAGVVMLAVFASFLWPSGVAPDTRLAVGRIDDYEVHQPVYFEEEQFWLVKQPDSSFIALYAINAHNQPGECPVEWFPDTSWPFSGPAFVVGFFRAPCHGETFDINGTRVFGPAPRGLDRFPVIVDGQRVTVDVHKGRLIKGSTESRPATFSP